MSSSLIVKYIIVAILGFAFGVFASNFTYFKIDPTISISDSIIFLGTSLLAIYVAKNIGSKLSKQQTVKSLYEADVKDLVLHIRKIETWVESGSVPFSEILPHLKRGTLKIQYLKATYANSKDIQLKDIDSILGKYNNLKTSITDLPAVLNTLSFDLANQTTFNNLIQELIVDLVNSIIKS